MSRTESMMDSRVFSVVIYDSVDGTQSDKPINYPVGWSPIFKLSIVVD